MFTSHIQLWPIFSPEDLQLLQRVFDQLCASKGLEKSTEEAKVLAQRLFVSYRLGVKDEAALLDKFL